MKELLKRLLIVPPIALAIFVFIWMSNREAPVADTPPEAVLAVRSLTLEPRDFSISVSGFGRVEAVRSWTAVAQVEGRLIELTENVSVGELVQKGDRLFSIDPRDYEIALAQAEASRDSAMADLQELDVTEKNYEDRLGVESEILSVLKTEMERQQSLVTGGGAAQTAVDSAVRSYLSQEKVVVDLEAQMALVDPQRVALQASLDSAEANIESAQRDLDNTKIFAPFTGRVVSRDAVEGQYIRIGDALVTIDDTEASEVEGSFQPGELGNMFQSIADTALVAALTQGAEGDAFSGVGSLGLDAKVRLATGGEENEWSASLVRTNGAIDTQTGAIGLVVRVEDPSRFEPTMRRPPLTNGSFVEVILTTPTARGALMVPRSAVHQDSQGTSAYVYLVDSESRLARADVKTDTLVGNDVIVTEGLAAGDRVILSEPQPPILGILLEPVEPTE